MFGIIAITFIVSSLGIGGGYLLWLKTRPHKETWRAKVYKLSEGVRDVKIEDGKIVSNIKLNDLQEHFIDIAERVNPEPGITVYRLQKRNKAIPNVTTEAVERWGDIREINLVEVQGSYYLLKKGFESKSGEAIFSPMKVDDLNMTESEMMVRKKRYKKEKDILEAISPWIVTALLCLTLIAITYMIIDGYTTITEKFNEGVEKMSSALDRAGENAKVIAGTSEAKVIPKAEPGKKPVLIE